MATKKPKVQAVRKPESIFPTIHPAWAISLMLAVFAITRYWAAAAGLQWISYPSGKSLFSDVTLYDFWGFNIAHGIFPDSSTLSQDQLWTKDAWQYPALAALIFILGNKIHGAMIGFIQLAILADLALLSILIWHGRE
ncbi:MAG: hypothetical protein EBR84_02580, partial [Actinobacteria bacterium]|nr:hypothetical protein [Actinomycetota bacterium]